MNNTFHNTVVALIVTAALTATYNIDPSHWGVWAAVAMFCTLFVLINYAVTGPEDSARITRLIERDDNLGLYSALVRRITRRLTQMISPLTAQDDPPPSKGWWAKLEWWTTPRAKDAADLARLQNSTMSWPVMDAALKLAVMYPLFLMLAQWWWTGADTGIGAVTVLSANDTFWIRSALFCPLVLTLLAQLNASARQRPIDQAAADVLRLVAVAVGVLFAGGGFAGLVAVAVALAAGATGALAVAFAVAGAIAGAVALAFASALASAGALAGAGAGALAGVGLLTKACQNGHGQRAYVLCVLIVLALTLGGLAAMPAPAEGAFDRRIFVFAIGPLILINAIFDFASYALTLQLIKTGKAKGMQRALLCGAVDAIAAVFLLFGVAFTLLCCVAVINAISAAPLFDIPTVLKDLKHPDTRAPYTWLYLTMFSTLIPTLVHLCIAAFSALAMVPPSYKKSIAYMIGPDSDGHLTTLVGTLAASAIGVGYAAFITTFFAGLWWILTTQIGTFALWLLNAVEGAATALSLL